MEAVALITKNTLGPKFFYCCRSHTSQLQRMDLLTGEESWHKVPGYQFKFGCRWTELPGDSILITGGLPAVSEVVEIDALREYAVCSRPPMHSARYVHGTVYHSQYLYVLGGKNLTNLSECERYVCAESRWEVLPALPVACCSMSVVELENSLYALGGHNGRNLGTVQKLCLDSLTWQLMPLKLPQAAYWSPCFKTDTQVYLVIGETLYSFNSLQIKPIKTLPQIMKSVMSYYSRGTLYCSLNGEISSLSVGVN
jgi:hypothetical protein